MKRHIAFYRLAMVLCAAHLAMSGLAQSVDETARKRLDTISLGLERFLFVNRFESVESPCLYIDPDDSTRATPHRKNINSNYRKLLTDSVMDPDGVKCLSNYYAKYVRFKMDTIIVDSLIIKGRVEMTYGYPAPSLIQYLCITAGAPAMDSAFFKKLIKSEGTFTMYPEKDKYVISLVFQKEPFDPRDTVYGYLEIVKNFFGSDATPSFHFFFDHISLYKGDKNNPISLYYTSTSHNREMIYYTEMVREVPANAGSADKIRHANAVWLSNYLVNPACLHCNLIYGPASANFKHFILPNTQPQPAH